MCFVLYLGTDQPVGTIPWNDRNPKLNTQDLTELDAGVVRHFEAPHVKYLGSDQGCGCGFRHVSYQNGEWPGESMIGKEHDTGGEQQPNHEQLHAFLKELLEQSDRVELYGCWDGEIMEASAGVAELPLDRILDRDFYFRERHGYTIRRSGDGGGDGRPTPLIPIPTLTHSRHLRLTPASCPATPTTSRRPRSSARPFPARVFPPRRSRAVFPG